MNLEGLNVKQTIACNHILQGKNIFLTGQGGTGKSYTIKRLYRHLNLKKNVGLTSLTGVSALIIGGRTLHSFLGIGLGTETEDTLYAKISKNRKILNKWRSLHLLIIDEVSMMNVALFEKLNSLAKRIRLSERPFGGIQLLLSADFLQLPPVSKQRDVDTIFCFETDAWKECIDEVVYLTDIVRQQDATFCKALSEIRLGCVSDETKELIGSRECEYPKTEDGIIPMAIYPVNQQVESVNSDYYTRLDGNERVYVRKVDWKKNHTMKEKFEQNIPLPERLYLKVGSQVMHLINDPMNELVNGSVGIITSFTADVPVVKFFNGVHATINTTTQTVME